jgi:hypothetical protein
MILDASEKFQLVKKVQQYLPDYAFNVTVHANNAVRVKNIRERFMKILTSKENPDGYIIQTSTSSPLFITFSLPLPNPYTIRTRYCTCVKTVVSLIAIQNAIEMNLLHHYIFGTFLLPLTSLQVNSDRIALLFDKLLPLLVTLTYPYL